MSVVSTLITSARSDVRAILRDGYSTFYSLLVARDGERCARCGAAGKMQIDHIHPVAQGGPSDLWNLQLLCAACNNAKGNRMADHRPPVAGKTLRDFQQEANDNMDAAEARGVKSFLLALATGTGKTVTAAHAIKRRIERGRALFTAPLDAVVEQSAKALQREMPGIPIGIVKGPLNQINSRIVVASLQTLAREKRIAKLEHTIGTRGGFQTLVIDEAHLQLDAYKKVIARLAAPDATIIGLSATPYRLDGRGLDEVFAEIIGQKSTPEAIRDGYLVDAQIVPFKLIGADFSKVKTSKGDLDASGLEAVMKASNFAEQITAQWEKHARHLRTVIFLPKLAMAFELAEYMRAGGIRAEAIKGGDAREKRALTRKYETGEVQVIVNVLALGTGWDSPITECLVMGRPTKSKALFWQMLGRGLRVLDGTVDGLDTAEERRAAILASAKKNCLVLDMVGATEKHGKVIHLADLAGVEIAKEGETLTEAIERAEEETKRAAEQEERERLEGELRAEAARSLVEWQGNGGKALVWKNQGFGVFDAIAGGYNFRVWSDATANGFTYTGVVYHLNNPAVATPPQEFDSVAKAKAFCQVEADKLFAKTEKPKAKPTPTFTWQSTIDRRSTLTIRNHTITVRPMADDNWIATDGQKFRAICATEAECRAAAEGFAKTLFFGGTDAKWRRDPATEDQLVKLKKWRVPHDAATITKGEASDAIGRKLAEFNAKITCT